MLRLQGVRRDPRRQDHQGGKSATLRTQLRDPCVSAPPRIPEVIEVNIDTPELPIAMPREDRVLPPEIPAAAAAEYYDDNEDVGNMQRARAFWRARERALTAEQLPNQGGGAWSPGHSDRSELHHHFQELEARIKALQESQPVPVEADGPRLQARSPPPTRRPQRRRSLQLPLSDLDDVTPPRTPWYLLQDFQLRCKTTTNTTIIFENTNFIPLPTTAVRNHEVQGVQGPPGYPPSSSSSRSSSTSSRSTGRKKVKKKEKK